MKKAQKEAPAVPVSKDGASAAVQAVMANIIDVDSISGCSELIQTTSGCRQKRMDRI